MDANKPEAFAVTRITGYVVLAFKRRKEDYPEGTDPRILETPEYKICPNRPAKEIQVWQGGTMIRSETDPERIAGFYIQGIHEAIREGYGTDQYASFQRKSLSNAFEGRWPWKDGK
jgi:hypothetical protein